MEEAGGEAAAPTPEPEQEAETRPGEAEGEPDTGEPDVEEAGGEAAAPTPEPEQEAETRPGEAEGEPDTEEPGVEEAVGEAAAPTPGPEQPPETQPGEAEEEPDTGGPAGEEEGGEAAAPTPEPEQPPETQPGETEEEPDTGEPAGEEEGGEAAAPTPEPEQEPETEPAETEEEPEAEPEPTGVLLDYEELEFEVLSEIESEVPGEERVLELPVEPDWIGRRLEITVRYEARGGASEESELRSLDVTGPLPQVQGVVVEVGPRELSVRWQDPRGALGQAPLADVLFEVFRRRGDESERLGRSFGPTQTDADVVWGEEVCYHARLVVAGDEEERVIPDPGPAAPAGRRERKAPRRSQLRNRAPGRPQLRNRAPGNRRLRARPVRPARLGHPQGKPGIPKGRRRFLRRNPKPRGRRGPRSRFGSPAPEPGR